MSAAVDQSEENEENEEQRKVRARQFCSVSEHAFNFFPSHTCACTHAHTHHTHTYTCDTHTPSQAEQQLVQHELEERVQEQHRLSQQREKQLQEEIQRLHSEITKVTNHFSQNRKTLPTTSLSPLTPFSKRVSYKRMPTR